MNKHSNFGFSSILLAFVMICILTFSALALITANSDYQLSHKVESNNTAYYSAEKKAYLILSEIDEALAYIYQDSLDENDYYKKIKDNIPKISQCSLTEDKGQYIVSYTIPIQTDQNLAVTLSLSYPANGQSGFYSILGWESIHESVYVEDQPLNLMGFDE